MRVRGLFLGVTMAGKNLEVKRVVSEKQRSAARKKPGMGGKGKFYRVVVRDKNDFVIFRNHDVGKKGHVERLAGKRANGRWATVSWLIDKDEAHVTNGVLIGDNDDVRGVLGKLRRRPRYLKGDIFEAGPRVNVPERLKPTPAMKRAQMRNIKKAQDGRWA